MNKVILVVAFAILGISSTVSANTSASENNDTNVLSGSRAVQFNISQR